MSSTPERPHAPVGWSERIERLDIDEGIDWDRVHGLVQQYLGDLSDEVVGRGRGVQVLPRTKTMGRSCLFSYRTFEVPSDPAILPVVAGIEFTPSAGRLLVRGDICSEETGKIWYESEREVDRARSTIEPAAQEIASKLRSQAELLLRILAGGAS